MAEGMEQFITATWHCCAINGRYRDSSRRELRFNAGWSSPVARQAHNLKVVGSNPTPATKLARNLKWLRAFGFLGYVPK